MQQEHIWSESQKQFLRDRLHLKWVDVYKEYLSSYGPIDIGIFQIKFNDFVNRFTKHHKFTKEERDFLRSANFSDDVIEKEFDSNFGTDLPKGFILKYKQRLLNPPIRKPKSKPKTQDDIEMEFETRWQIMEEKFFEMEKKGKTVLLDSLYIYLSFFNVEKWFTI